MDKELEGCAAYPRDATCPVEWCERNRHDAMCMKHKCKHYTPDVRVEKSVFQAEKRLKQHVFTDKLKASND